ncbi:hypothetical protein [Nocardia thailandica]|uniref:hypothetical protein n=1 Tax=Nocardia thailandica TaxID=257275 RepID=UPI0002FA75F4|nr:hypothetical protein [Nocardia thailandica]
MPRIYRVVGVDKDDVVQFEWEMATARSARKAAARANRRAAKLDSPHTWRAEYADIEWKALP